MSYTYADVYRAVTVGSARAIEDQHVMLIINRAQNLIWRSADWRWTITNLDPFWLEPNIQDYGTPIIAIPDNFQRIQTAFIRRITEPAPITTPLKPVFELNVENTQGFPSHISFLRATRTLRLWPIPSGGMGSPNYLVNGTYKTRPTRVTTTTYQTTELPSQDEQIEMWTAAIEWSYAVHIKDPEAGAIQVFPDGRKAYTKKLAMAMAAIDQEAKNEGLNQGGPQIAPSESLVEPVSMGWIW